MFVPTSPVASPPRCPRPSCKVGRAHYVKRYESVNGVGTVSARPYTWDAWLDLAQRSLLP